MPWTGHRLLTVIGLAGAMALGGCAYDDGYGYGGASVGVGYYGGGGYGDYYDNGYYGGVGYQPGYFGGWYNNFYYPGNGYYIYDRSGNRHRWNDSQRRYWEGRRQGRGNDGRGRGNWNGGQGRPDWQNGQRPGYSDGRGDGDGRGGERSRRGGQVVPGTNYVLPPKARLLRTPGQNETRQAQPQPGVRSAPRARSDGGNRSGRGGGRRGRSD